MERNASARVDIPDVIIGNTLGSAKNIDAYADAKAGSISAAAQVALHLVNDALCTTVRQIAAGDDPIIQPVHAIEATGRNKIPHAAAKLLSIHLGHEVGCDIIQASSPKRTAMAGLERIFNRPVFSGDVEPGRAYILIDDTLTQGGTFAALEQHIVAGGGKVIGAIALTGKQYGSCLRLQEETLDKLRGAYGDLEARFQEQTGYGFDQLTESEARYLASYKPSAVVRDRIISGYSHIDSLDIAGGGSTQDMASLRHDSVHTAEALAGRMVSTLSITKAQRPTLRP